MFLYYCVSVKHIMLCNNPCSSPSRFSVSRVVDFRIVNRYCWLWKFLNMANQGRKFSIFRGNHEKIDIRIGISLFHKAYDHQIWQSSTSIGTDSNKTNQTGADDAKSGDKRKTLYFHYQRAYGHQTWQKGKLPWWAFTHKFKWTLIAWSCKIMW